ncbi:hypothetical protein AXA84_0437, partial [Candidatus Phytoplasma oryzae]
MFPNKQFLEKIRSVILKNNETKNLKIEDKDLITVYNYQILIYGKGGKNRYLPIH